MEQVRMGSRGDAALIAQRLLNDRIRELPEVGGRPNIMLVEDGVFGPKSQEALKTFLNRGAMISHQPVIDAQVWRQLGLKIDIEHRIVRVAQPTGGQCWSAAAAMILGGPMSVTSGNATFSQRGSLDSSFENLREFGASLGWRAVMPTLNVTQFAAMLRFRPLWMAGQGLAGNRALYGHALVVSAMWSDGDPTGSSAWLRINDPWPPGRGLGRQYLTGFFSPAGISLPNGLWFRPKIILIPN